MFIANQQDVFASIKDIWKSPLLLLYFVVSPDVFPPAPLQRLKVGNGFSLFLADGANICLDVSLGNDISTAESF